MSVQNPEDLQASVSHFGRSWLQGFLPGQLRTNYGYNGRRQTPFGQALSAGTNNLAELFTNPGGFAGNISQAIAPRVAMEQEAIGRGTAGGMAEAAGRASRSGTAGTGIAQALQAAIQQSGERQKAGSVRQAQVDSAQLRRQDLSTMLQVYQMLIDQSNAGRKFLQKGSDMSHSRYQDRRNNFMNNFKVAGSIISGAGGALS